MTQITMHNVIFCYLWVTHAITHISTGGFFLCKGQGPQLLFIVVWDWTRE